MNFFLSEVPFPPQSILVDFVWGAIGVLSVTALILVVIVNWKKAFGRAPSLDEIISGLMTANDFKAYKEEQRLRNVGLEKQISDARHSFDERANSDLLRHEKMFGEIFERSRERDQEFKAMRDVISRLQERTETHIRKIDQFDLKMDNLLKEAANVIRQPKRS